MRKKKKKQEVGISSSMMVDVLFILLIFFVLVSTIKKDKIQVNPTKIKKTAQKEKSKKPQKSIIVSIDKTNHTFINGTAAKNEKQLRKMLAKIKKNNPKGSELEVIFRTDGESKNFQTTKILALLSEYELIENLQWEAQGE